MSEPTQPAAPAWPAEPTVPDARPEGRPENRPESRIDAKPAAGSDAARAALPAEIAADLAEAATQIAEAITPDRRTHRPAEPRAATVLQVAERDLAALERAAVAVQPRAYAPYSRFQVGAAVWGEGQRFLGVNVENASFGLTICAERNAVAQAVAGGVGKIAAIAVCTSASPPSSPCGSCRQVLAELAEDPRSFRVIAVNPDGERREWTLDQLLPDSFTSAELPGQGR